MTNVIPKTQNRDTHLDSLKFLLASIVVFCHATLYTNGGEEDFLNGRLLIFFTTFLMPLFIFISGYLSKGLTFQKFLKNSYPLLVSYIVFQIILTLPDLLAAKVHPIWFLLQPTNVMWYIACLIIWRLVICFLPKKTRFAPLIIVASFIISFSTGFFIDGNMATRVLTFLPYFIMGYYSTPEIIAKIRGINKIVAGLFIVAIFFAIYEFAPKAFIYSLYGDVLYSNFMVSDNLFSVSTIGAAFRIISYGLAITMSCAIMCITPNSFARWGGKTLYVYLLHAVFVYLVYYCVLNHFAIESYATMHFIVTVLLVCIIIYLSKFRIVQCIVDPVNNLFRKKK